MVSERRADDVQLDQERRKVRDVLQPNRSAACAEPMTSSRFAPPTDAAGAVRLVEHREGPGDDPDEASGRGAECSHADVL